MWAFKKIKQIYVSLIYNLNQCFRDDVFVCVCLTYDLNPCLRWARVQSDLVSSIKRQKFIILLFIYIYKARSAQWLVYLFFIDMRCFKPKFGMGVGARRTTVKVIGICLARNRQCEKLYIEEGCVEMLHLTTSIFKLYFSLRIMRFSNVKIPIQKY